MQDVYRYIDENRDRFLDELNVPYAPHDENNHAPNENLKVEGFYSGIKTTTAFLFEAAKL